MRNAFTPCCAPPAPALARPSLALSRSPRPTSARRPAPTARLEAQDHSSLATQEPVVGGVVQQGGFALSERPLLCFDDLADLADDLSRAGAYAVRDESGRLQCIGSARDIGARLRAHASAMSRAQCASFQVYMSGEADVLDAVIEYWQAESRRQGDAPAAPPADRKVVYAAILSMFLLHSIVKQVAYFAGGY